MSRALCKRSVLLCVALGLVWPRWLWAQEPQPTQPAAPAAVAVPQVSPESDGQAVESASANNPTGNHPATGPADMASPTYRRTTENRPASDSMTERIEQALGKSVVVEFNETPLSEVMTYLQQYSQVPIYLDLKALDDVGLGPDTPITIAIRGVSLRSALNLILNELDLTFIIRDESLSITSPDQAETVLLTRVYPVADFAVPAPPSLIVPEPYSRYSVLLKLLSECVAPQTWEEVGGAGNALVYEPWGMLIVTQTKDVHEALELLLTALRKARAVSDVAPHAALPWVSQQARDNIEKALDSTVSFEFSEAPLQEFVAFLAQDREIPVLIDKRALADVGLGGDTPVTLTVRDMTVRSALRLTLRQLNLEFTIRDEVLLVTTPEVIQKELGIRVYSVADFLDGTSPAVNPLETDARIKSLQDVVERTIAPDSWDHVGGAGALSPVAAWGLLVISQTEEVHAQIEALLQQTRQVFRSQQGAESAPAEQLSAASVPSPSAILEPADIPVVAQTLVIPGPNSGSATALVPPAALAPSSLSSSLLLKVYAVPDFDSDQLVKAIRGTVAPASWTNDPAGPAIFTVGMNLLIRQTDSEHALIEQLIQGLRPRKGVPIPR